MRIVFKLLLRGVVLLFCMLILLPVFWGIVISFKTRVDALSMPPNWFFSPTLDNYRTVLFESGNLRALSNSCMIALGSTVLALSAGIPAAFVFSRVRSERYGNLFKTILAVRMAPPTVIALPLFLVFSFLRLIDTYVAIILVHAAINLPVAIWLLKSFLDQVPVGIDEAAILDGDSLPQVMLRQILPLCIPGLLMTAGLCFVSSWSEFFLALSLTGYETRPFTVSVSGLITPHGTYWGQVAAISTIGLLPSAALAAFARWYFAPRVKEARSR